MCEHHPECACPAFTTSELVEAKLRRLFEKHNLNVTIGRYDDGGLYLQSHDERLVTLTRGDR